MTLKQQRFVAEYLIDLNATQAAIRTGYSKKTASSQGERLLRNAEIAKAVAENHAKHLASNDLSAARVLEELRRLALSDPRQFWNADGSLRSIQDLSAEDASCLAGFEAVIKNAESGDGHTDTVHKIKFWDKTRALEMLAKHFGVLTEQIEHRGTLKISWLE